MRPPTQSTAAPALKQPPASKKGQNKTTSLEDDATTQEGRATTRKKRVVDEVPKDSSSDDDLPVGPIKAKGKARGRGGRPGKRQRRSASPMPPPATEKRVPTNNHPGLIDKKTCRSSLRADVAAEKAMKESEAAIAAAVEEKTLTRLAEIEMEQESMEKIRVKQIVRKRPAATDATDASHWQGDASGNTTGVMDVDSDDEDLSQLMDVDNSGNDSDDDQSDGSDTEKEVATKKVTILVRFFD